MTDPAFLLLAGLAALWEPPVDLGDLRQMPPPSVAAWASHAAGEAARMARDRGRANLHQQEWWRQAAEEAGDASLAWGLLFDARNEAGLGVRERLDALGRLRGIVGFRAYYAGAMPPPVPVWRFPSVP